MAKDTLTVTDNRTGKTFELPIKDGTVRAMDFRQMKTDEKDFGLMTYDPAFQNTASTLSMSLANSCWRKSVEVSTSSREPSSLSTRIETRERRFFGSFGSHSPQSLPMRGTPVEVPEPSTTSFTGWPC